MTDPRMEAVPRGGNSRRAQAVDVTAGIQVGPTGGLLGGKVGRRARNRSPSAQFFRQVCPRRDLNQSEIEKLDNVRDAAELGDQ